MMKHTKQLILGLSILLSSAFALAQQRIITGTVTSVTENTPLPGVTVIIKNTTQGTTTDFDGVFSIAASPEDVLEFSYIGYTSKEILVGETNSLTISLQEAVSALDEIVVVGYGTQRKKEVTGAVEVINSEAIEKLNPTRIENALQGQISGVNIVSNSGAPGSGSSIRIRGISTNGENKPYILVDGNVIEDLSVINPNDIESINVLKDATAGIYGVRAANGVIIITTKSGRKNTPLTFNIDSYAGFQYTSKKLDLLNPREFALYVNDASGKTKFFVYPETGTDWQDEVFSTAAISNINVSASGGTEKSTYSFGVSYLDQDGIVGLGKSNYSRLTARLNYKYDLLDNLKIKATGLYTHSDKHNLPEGGIGAVLYNAVNINPNLTVYDQNGNYSLVEEISQIEIINPIAQIANTHNTTRIDKFAFTYGKVEVRAKLPKTKGTWPAIWMLGSDFPTVGWPSCGEIDIMEQRGADKTKVLGTRHWLNTSNSTHASHSKETSVSNSDSEFHVYALEWNENTIKMFVDNVKYYELALNDSLPFDNDFFIILNMAVGGTLGGTIAPDFTEDVMEIDYIRVYQ